MLRCWHVFLIFFILIQSKKRLAKDKMYVSKSSVSQFSIFEFFSKIIRKINIWTIDSLEMEMFDKILLLRTVLVSAESDSVQC